MADGDHDDDDVAKAVASSVHLTTTDMDDTEESGVDTTTSHAPSTSMASNDELELAPTPVEDIAATGAGEKEDLVSEQMVSAAGEMETSGSDETADKAPVTTDVDADEEEPSEEDDEAPPESTDSDDELEEANFWHDQIIAELFRAARDASPLLGGYKYLSTLPGVDRMGNIRHTARATRTGEVVLLRVTPLVPPVERFFGQRLINELFLMRDMAPSPNVLGFYDLYLSQKEEEGEDEDEDEDEDDDEEKEKEEKRGKSDVWLVQQYLQDGASLGELVVYNNGPGGFTEEQVARICLETSKGLAHLHKQLIIHRDMRSDSILVDPKGRVKITNFAYAVQLPTLASKRRTMVSTLALPSRSPYTPDKTHWTSPEVIRRREYGMEVDIWALGITMMEMLDGRPPHSGNAALRVLFLILISGTPTLSRSDADALGPDLREFLAKCVEVDVEKRSSAAELVEHPFLQRACPPLDLASLFEYRTREPPPEDEDEDEEAVEGAAPVEGEDVAVGQPSVEPEPEVGVEVQPEVESPSAGPEPSQESKPDALALPAEAEAGVSVHVENDEKQTVPTQTPTDGDREGEKAADAGLVEGA